MKRDAVIITAPTWRQEQHEWPENEFDFQFDSDQSSIRIPCDFDPKNEPDCCSMICKSSLSLRSTAHAVLGLLLLYLPHPAAGDEVAKGKELAGRMCAVCHMNPGQGEKQGAQGVPGFAAVANRPGQTAEGVVRWLQSAPPMMPDHRLSRDEASALAEFILSLGKGR